MTNANTPSENVRDHFLSNKLYNVIKFIAQILLPAIGTLYFALAEIWSLADADEIVGSIVAFDTFLGVVLGFSTSSYNKSEAKYDGSIVVQNQPNGPKVYSLELKSDPTDLDKKSQVLFKMEAK